MSNIFFIHSSVDGHIGCLHVLAIVYSAAMNIVVHVSYLFFFLNIFIHTVYLRRRTIKCPSTDEWIKKMWHIYTMEYYSAIKRHEIELFVVRWMDLESVLQSEVSQKGKNKHCMLTHIYGIKNFLLTMILL